MNQTVFHEPVIYFQRLENASGTGPWSNQWIVLIVTKTGREFTFYNHPIEPDQLKLDLRLDVIGPDDQVPEEYAHLPLSLREQKTIVAVWTARSPADPPTNFKLFCSQDQQDAFNDEIYPPDENTALEDFA